jgi:hypothetical protein
VGHLKELNDQRTLWLIAKWVVATLVFLGLSVTSLADTLPAQAPPRSTFSDELSVDLQSRATSFQLSDTSISNDTDAVALTFVTTGTRARPIVFDNFAGGSLFYLSADCVMHTLLSC